MEKLELDQRIRTKNLELSKALQTIDRLKTIKVELEERIKELEAREMVVNPCFNE